MMILTLLGSDTFANKLKYGYWIVLPMSMALCFKVKDKIPNSRYIGVFSRLAIAATGTLLVLGIISQFHGAYLDNSNRLKLNTQFNHPSLKHIHSSPERVEGVDKVLEAIEKYTQKGDRILCIGKIPLFYYLAEREPYIYAPWPTYLSKEKLSNLLTQNYKEFGLPKVIITTKLSVSHRNWPKTDAKYFEKKAHYSILRKFIKKHRYMRIWESKMFKIYSPAD